MLRDVTSIEVVGDHHLRVSFDDGMEGVVDVRVLVPFRGVFALLESPEYFARAKVNAELGTVQWPNGADLDPVVLYAEVTKSPLPKWAVDPAIA